jgi:signal transduction histidine kinase
VHRQLSEQQQRTETLEQQALQLEGLANLGSATAMIAHEINNLLTPLTNYAEIALQNPDDKALTERALRKTAQNCRQAGKVMESILAMANAACAEKVQTPLLPLVNGVFDCLCRDFKKDGITVEIRVREDLQVWAAPIQLQQALMNLILNAREAMIPRGGVLTIEAEDRAEDIRIRVRDTGCGIEQSQMKKVFDSFFSTKNKQGSEQSACGEPALSLPVESLSNQSNGHSRTASGEHSRTGTGLGLALCKKVVDAHNGSISVDSQPGQGTTFTIVLPKK